MDMFLVDFSKSPQPIAMQVLTGDSVSQVHQVGQIRSSPLDTLEDP